MVSSKTSNHFKAVYEIKRVSEAKICTKVR